MKNIIFTHEVSFNRFGQIFIKKKVNFRSRSTFYRFLLQKIV